MFLGVNFLVGCAMSLTSTLAVSGGLSWSATLTGDVVTITIHTENLSPHECIVDGIATVTVDGVDREIRIQPRVLRRSKAPFVQKEKLPKTPATFVAKRFKAKSDDCRVVHDPPRG